MTSEVRSYLRRGIVPTEQTEAVAAACDAYIRQEGQKAPRRAVSLARTFVKRSRRHGGALLRTSLRSLGWALRLDSNFDGAAEAYLEARGMFRSDPLSRARIDRILIDIFMYLGRIAESRRRMRLAKQTFARLRLKDEVARTEVNWANVLHRQDRHAEALKIYRRAGAYFRSVSDPVATALCAYNEANGLVQLMQFDKAARAYSTAEELFRQEHHDLFALECRYGTAWLHMLQGDYHNALRGLADCEQGYRCLAHPRGVMLCQLDRAEVFLDLNLYTDARRAAQEAGRYARRLRMRYESAKSDFFLGKASLAAGNLTAARKSLAQAAKKFTEEKNQPYLAAVQLTVNAMQNGKHSPIELMAARKKFNRAQLPLWEAICDLQLIARGSDDSETWRHLRYNRAVRSVPHLYAQYQTLLGDRYARRGEPGRARGCWVRAVEALDAVRSQLPPVDIRSTFLRHRTDPYRRLIRSDLADDPSAAAAWSERLQCSGLWNNAELSIENRRARDKAIRGLSELARSVTAISSQLSSEVGRRAASGESRQFRHLEDRIRLALSALDASSPSAVGRTSGLKASFLEISRKLPIVQFIHDANDLIVLVHEDGSTRSRLLPGGRRQLGQMVGCWQLLMSRAMNQTDRTSSRPVSEEKVLFGRIGDWLWKPLEISSHHQRVLILPESKITNLPWSAISVDSSPLGDRHHLIIAPSLRHYRRAAETKVRSRRIELLVGRSPDLKGIESEMDLFARTSDRPLKVHDPCRRSDWPDRSSADLWHYTGHAVLRSDNPFYSCLLLDDGPLYAADFRLKSNRVNLVTLAACRTGQQVYLPGEEMTGLVRALLEMGARSVLAGLWAISDQTTSDWMREFYDNYLSGKTVEQSYRRAARTIREQYPSAYDWAAFAVYGAG